MGNNFISALFEGEDDMEISYIQIATIVSFYGHLLWDKNRTSRQIMYCIKRKGNELIPGPYPEIPIENFHPEFSNILTFEKQISENNPNWFVFYDQTGNAVELALSNYEVSHTNGTGESGSKLDIVKHHTKSEFAKKL